MKPRTWLSRTMKFMPGSPWARRRTKPLSTGASARPGSATLLSRPIGNPSNAVCTASGSGGVKRRAPAASTPVETVTMQALARRVPRAVWT